MNITGGLSSRQWNLLSSYVSAAAFDLFYGSTPCTERVIEVLSGDDCVIDIAAFVSHVENTMMKKCSRSILVLPTLGHSLDRLKQSERPPSGSQRSEYACAKRLNGRVWFYTEPRASGLDEESDTMTANHDLLYNRLTLPRVCVGTFCHDGPGNLSPVYFSACSYCTK